MTATATATTTIDIGRTDTGLVRRAAPVPTSPILQARTAPERRDHRPAGLRRETPWRPSTGWHSADWGPWGAAESLVKILAILTGLFAAFPDGAFAIPEAGGPAYWVLVGLAAAYGFSLFDRIKDRELTALAFWGLNVSGHLAVVYAMGATTWPQTPVRGFAALMLIGDLIKLGFFLRTGARIRNLPRAVPILLTAVFAVLYAIVLATA